MPPIEGLKYPKACELNCASCRVFLEERGLMLRRVTRAAVPLRETAAMLRRLDPAAGGAALMRLASESPGLVERLFDCMDPLTAEVRVH